MDYRGLVAKCVEEVLTHSTVISRVWLTVLFIFRVLMLMVGMVGLTPTIPEISCHTQQPGCTQACYDSFFYVLPIRFFWTQLIFVSTPTVLYLAYAMHDIYRAGHFTGVPPKHTKPKADVNVSKSVLCGYFSQLLVKITMELAFIVGQYCLYGLVMSRELACRVYPCSHTVECILSRCTEMSIISIYMFAVACASVILNVLEGIVLLKRLRTKREKLCQRESLIFMFDRCSKKCCPNTGY
ncbi:hypothetical protein P4O66_001107 [Electrophorus voltai]|uniref:Gap junction protein cysteine-rich domain-containing protein n=1 Tax=Electrophorus voltai TaxID=2609070 RepID=A0AAD8ZAC7_9TELE|nr:hypothetical protein P4O66_001107 [Electrophorus voltai]